MIPDRRALTSVNCYDHEKLGRSYIFVGISFGVLIYSGESFYNGKDHLLEFNQGRKRRCTPSSSNWGLLR